MHHTDVLVLAKRILQTVSLLKFFTKAKHYIAPLMPANLCALKSQLRTNISLTSDIAYHYFYTFSEKLI